MALVLPFTETDLMVAAGLLSYERGLEYLDQVEDLEISDAEVTANVFGTREYQVRLSFGTLHGAMTLSGDCSCPFGQEANFCKHCVAVGLTAIKIAATRKASKASKAREPKQHPDGDVVASWLDSLTKDELAAEIQELIDADPDLRKRFELKAAARQADIGQVREAVLDLLETDGYLGYDEAKAYARDVRQAAEAIDALIDTGADAAAQAIGLAREAFDWLMESLTSADDTSGAIGAAAHDLFAVHLRACQAAPQPDPVELGTYLADLILFDEYGLTPDLEDYTGVLGRAGTVAIRDRIDAVYKAEPDNWNARQLTESLLKAEGDTDALVAFYAAQLDDTGRQHLVIAGVLDQAGRTGESLTWAERGVRAATKPDSELVEYLAARYTAANRSDDVANLRRTIFKAERSLASYRALRESAKKINTWDAERSLALAQLRKDAKNTTAWSWDGPVLIDALLDDGDATAALAVYLAAVEQLTTQTGDNVYRQLARLLTGARACHEALGTLDEFRDYMSDFRTAQKRKRNLMKILTENSL
jgi:uncharacterized Zn finger protein